MALAGDLTEDFQATLDTGKWSQVDAAGITQAVTDNRYQFAIDASAVGYAKLTSVNSYDLTGSHVQVRLWDAGDQSGTGMEAYPLMLEADANNRLQFVVANNLIGIYKVVAGTATGLSFPAYDANTHRWLRIRESAGTSYWDYSSDGFTWTNFTSTANPIELASVQVSLQAGSFAGRAADATVVYDNVNVGPVTGTASPAALAVTTATKATKSTATMAGG